MALPATAPLPPQRPDRTMLHENMHGMPSDEGQGEKQTSDAEDGAAACDERLARLGVQFEKRARVEEGACSIRNPVLVSALPNSIEVSPASLMECSFAEGLVRWVNDVVVPRTREHLQSKPTRLLIGTSYQCRDQRSGGKLSEHAFGNGVDVMGFDFDNHPPLVIKSQPEDSPEAAFQNAIRKEACSIFTTVLGPGSDSDHSDHLHVDMRERKGDYRICQ